MGNGKILHGFTFMLGKKDIFVVTDYKNKTEKLARKILRKMGIPENSSTIKELLYWLEKAKCEMCTCNGRKYYEISGKNFGGRGSFIDDGMTEIIEIM